MKQSFKFIKSYLNLNADLNQEDVFEYITMPLYIKIRVRQTQKSVTLYLKGFQYCQWHLEP